MTPFLNADRRQALKDQLVALTCPETYADQLTVTVPDTDNMELLDKNLTQMATHLLTWSENLVKSLEEENQEDVEMYIMYIKANITMLETHIAECVERGLLTNGNLPNLLNQVISSIPQVKALKEQAIEIAIQFKGGETPAVLH